MRAISQYLSCRFNIIFIAALSYLLCACEKILNAELTAEPMITNETFEKAVGIELPYQLYMPSSIIGWSFTDPTRFKFDHQRNTYVIDGIPLDRPAFDELGYRFKLCSDSWRYQFGFGTYITDDESTIGISPQGTVVRVERFAKPAADIRIELPPRAPNSPTRPFMKVEFKLIRWEPTPEGLLKVTLYEVARDS